MISDRMQFYTDEQHRYGMNVLLFEQGETGILPLPHFKLTLGGFIIIPAQMQKSMYHNSA